MDTDKTEETARAEARKKIEEKDEKFYLRYDRLATPLIFLLALWGMFFTYLPLYFGEKGYIAEFWRNNVFYPNLGWWTPVVLFGNLLIFIAMLAALIKVLHLSGPKLRPLAQSIALLLISSFLIYLGFITAFLVLKIVIAVSVFPFTFGMVVAFVEFTRRLSLYDLPTTTDSKKKTRARLQISTALIIAILTALATFFQIIPHLFVLFGK